MNLVKYIEPSIKLFNDDFENFFRFPKINFNSFFDFDTDSLIKSPTHDIIENEKEYIVESSLAGIKKEDININIEKNKIIIEAERKENKDLKYNRKETYFGKYQRIFTLPDNVDDDNINASFNDGILTLIIPKIIDETKINKKKIEIK